MAGKILANVRATSSGSQTITASSIPQTFSHLEIVIHGQSTATTGSATIRFNNSSSSDHISLYCQSSLTNSGSVTVGGAVANASSVAYIGKFGNNGSTYRIWVPNYSSSSTHKPILFLGGDLANNTSYSDSGFAGFGSYMSNTPITSVNIGLMDVVAGTSLIIFGWL